jgi:outer membrane protein assembly factor BamB
VPTIDGRTVYVLGAEGRLQAISLDEGHVIWKRELKDDYGIEAPLWGFCGHPLVDGDRLFCLVGGEGSTVVAFDKRTGQELWRALSAAEPGYSPPVMISSAAGPQLVVWHSEAIQGLDPATGAVYWTEPLKPNYGMSIMGPRQAGDLLFASGIGDAAKLLKLHSEGRGVDVVWEGTKETAVYAGNATPIIDDGVIYSSDCQLGALRAVDLATGERLWETFAATTGGERRASHGTAFLTRHNDHYWILAETGDLILAELSREAYHELGRIPIIEPTGEAFGRSVAWTYPAFADGRLFIRNDKVLKCYSLRQSSQ